MGMDPAVREILCSRGYLPPALRTTRNVVMLRDGGMQTAVRLLMVRSSEGAEAGLRWQTGRDGD